jgi:hypothetical protein
LCHAFAPNIRQRNSKLLTFQEKTGFSPLFPFRPDYIAAPENKAGNSSSHASWQEPFCPSGDCKLQRGQKVRNRENPDFVLRNS